jgi:hypothetical protein
MAVPAGSLAQPKQADAFFKRLASLPLPSDPSKSPLTDITPALHPALTYESHLRTLFAQDRDNAELADPHVGLLDVHGAGAGDALKVRRRQVATDATLERKTDEPLPGGPRRDATLSDKQHVLALRDLMRRPHAESAFVDKQTFLHQFGVFTEGSPASFMPDDWKNVLVAGGSVLACLLPVPAHVQGKAKRELRRYYHEQAYFGSDVDPFIYGLDEEAAKRKMNRLAELIADAVPRDTLCVRTK